MTSITVKNCSPVDAIFGPASEWPANRGAAASELSGGTTDDWTVKVPFSRSSYEGVGGWDDGRLGQAYDLISAVLATRGEPERDHPLLSQIEAMDKEV